jgi:aspartyl-tRNA(Asn)/glutamyl-tRNA(Gln) amidotransferase subunit A
VPAPSVPEPPESLAGLSVGWLAGEEFGPVGSEVAAAVGHAADSLADLGAEVERADVPVLAGSDCNLLSLTLFGAEGRAYLDDAIAGRWDELHPVLSRRLASPLPTLEQYVAAEAEAEALRRDLAEVFRRYDLLLCPTVPVPAHPHGIEELVIDGRPHPPRTILRWTIPFDLTGSPALSVPFGMSSEGLPVGVQLVGRHFAEETVLKAGMGLEHARGPLPQPPLR